jgi:transcriptional regulator with XRE-family HTH domain
LRRILAAEIRATTDPDAKDGDSAALLAEKADTSARTVNRILSGQTETVSLDLADRLLIACGRAMWEVRVIYPDGTVEEG